MSLSYEQVSPKNVKLAIQLQNEIFPNENAKKELLAAADNNGTLRTRKPNYYLVYEGGGGISNRHLR